MAAEAPAGDRNLISRLLRGGLAVALLLMLAGAAARLASGEAVAPAVPLDAVLRGRASMGDWLMGLGVLALGLTPVLRVLALLVLWVRERDWRFALVAGAVLLTLGVSMALGVG